MSEFEDFQELQQLLNNLDVPEMRKTDLEWLNRNLLINNSSLDAVKAQKLITSILRERREKEGD